MGRKLSLPSEPEAERAQKLCKAAMAEPDGITIFCANRAAAMSTRELIYRGRRFYRDKDRNGPADSSPVSVVDMRVVCVEGRWALRVLPPGQFVKDEVEIISTRTGKPVELPDLYTPTDSIVDEDTHFTWLMTHLLERLEPFIRNANLQALPGKIIDWEGATQALIDARVRAHQEPESLYRMTIAAGAE